jgi:hypothetical protein
LGAAREENFLTRLRLGSIAIFAALCILWLVLGGGLSLSSVIAGIAVAGAVAGWATIAEI